MSNLRGRFSSTPPSMLDGQFSDLQLDENGNLKTSLINASANSEYETVAASATAQVLGSTGAVGDFLAGLLVIPATTAPGAVTILDNAISITVFTGGADSVGDLKPFPIPINAISVSGAWKVTTGANVSVLAIGTFT